VALFWVKLVYVFWILYRNKRIQLLTSRQRHHLLPRKQNDAVENKLDRAFVLSKHFEPTFIFVGEDKSLSLS
jgi:hypothetical protein